MELDFRELLKNRFFAFVVVSVVLTLILYFFPSHGINLTIILAAFVSSEWIIPMFVRGGDGIFIIPILGGNKTQPKGYAFVAFFSSIIFITILVNSAVATLIMTISPLFSDPAIDLLTGLILAGLVYLNMHGRFYVRKKTW